MASSQSSFGSDDRPARAAHGRRASTSPSTVARQSLSRIGDLARRPAATQLVAGRTQRAGQVGRAEAAQRQHVGDHPLARPCRRPGSSPRRRPCRTRPRCSRRRRAGNRRRGDRGRRQWLAAHRSAAVDQQAQRRVRRAPRPAPAAARGRSPRPRRGGLDDRVEAGIEVEVAAVGSVRLLDDLADAASRRSDPAGEIQEQPRRPAAGRARAVVGRSPR